MTRTVYARLTKLKTSSRAGFMRRYSCRRRTAPQNEQRALDRLLRERAKFRAAAACTLGRRERDAKSQAHRCVVLLCTSQKKASSAAFAAPATRRRRALPRGHRKPYPASASAPATGRAARGKHNLLAAPAVGSEQRRSGAVPGYPRELKGLTQNRDIHR